MWTILNSLILKRFDWKPRLSSIRKETATFAGNMKWLRKIIRSCKPKGGANVRETTDVRQK